MEKGYELGGRPFLAVQETSALQDMVFLDLVRTAGLDSLQMSEDEAPEDFAERILGALVTDGNVLKLLGCLIVPPALFPKRAGLFRRPGEVAPRKWTPDLGDETAAFLGDLTAPAEPRPDSPRPFFRERDCLFVDYADVLKRGGPQAPGGDRGGGDSKPGRYGDWTPIVLELAAGDHETAEAIFRWPLRAMLDHYRVKAREAAVADYRHRLLCYAVTAPHFKRGSRPRPPAVPDILKGGR